MSIRPKCWWCRRRRHSAWPPRGSAGRCPRQRNLSLHGRSLDLIRPHLHPGARILALTSDGAAPAQIAGLLAKAGFGGSRFTVLEALGGARERIRSATAAAFDLGEIDDLNIVAIVVAAGPDARIIARAPGLADDLFEHDGQLTKREIRALTLSSLAPCRGALLWDIGAGAGSVAIEWMLADPSLRAVRDRASVRPRRAYPAQCGGARRSGARGRRWPSPGSAAGAAPARCHIRRWRHQPGPARRRRGGAAAGRTPRRQCRDA